MAKLILDGGPLSREHVIAVAKGTSNVGVGPTAGQRLAESRAALEFAAGDGRTVYGVNTGFGSFARQRISTDQLHELQRNLIRSHAAGVGEPLSEDVVRGMLVVLAASLCRGASGVRPVLVEAICGLLNRGVTPVVPESGSVGASGDLAPLAHSALVLMGEGEAFFEGKRIAGGDALRAAGLDSTELEAKEGLALINGTHLMSARLALIVEGIERLWPATLAAAAMSLDACRSTDSFLHPEVYELRGHPECAEVAERFRGLLEGSEIIPSHANADDPRVQDPYSIRCAPIVLGSALSSIRYAQLALERELGAVTDNPLLVHEDEGEPARVVSAGNFHGMPMAIPLDVCAIALAHVAGIAERRVDHMLSAIDEQTNLRPFLSPVPGLHSGYMIAQYTAAALCNELIGLSMPASVSNLTTSAAMEDYNSFGPRAAAKAARGVHLTTRVVAIELLCAAQALEAHRPLKSGKGVERAHALVRASVAPLTEDRPPSPDIEALAGLIEDGSFAN
ncbi:MAG: histidine ammonia-lyase [Planctomycetota bacterium]